MVLTPQALPGRALRIACSKSVASKRCDHVSIQNNHVHHNGIIEESGQRIGNGIMLHRSSDHGIVRNNTVHDNMDSGVALFESSECTVSENKIYSNMSESCGHSSFGWSGGGVVERGRIASIQCRMMFTCAMFSGVFVGPIRATTTDETLFFSRCSSYLPLHSLYCGRRNPAVPRFR